MKWIYIPSYSDEDGRFYNLDKIVSISFSHNEFSNEVRMSIYFKNGNGLSYNEDSENGIDMTFKNYFNVKSNDDFIQEKIHKMRKLVKKNKNK